MFGHELTIKQARSSPAEQRHEPGKRHLAGVVSPAEHRFAAEHPAEPYAVEPADELIALPAFDRMSVPFRMQGAITCHYPPADPAFGMIGPGRGTLRHHLIERLVATHSEAILANRLGQRVREMEAGKRQDRATLGLYPEHFWIVAAIGHWKDAAAICEHQQFAGNER
ncbi:hypothetical protein GCM10011515_21310 [Tsuneonella deserti]|uniref:Uncharacterized protein n=1 Tax=Tsuneonella deserti TaxID=2035528 RepID=A0ABQ1S9J8_9SPHN|nr:hypothetical protein GCM10011515_21310 [Tsuneonella deserti]